VSGPEWDARTYDRIADPMHRWGLEVLDRLPLAGTERVLDAGCGSGRVTEALAERLPRGRVVALDASTAMLAEARRRLARFGHRIEYVQADLGRPLPIEGQIDAILSTATFHWVPDHDALFRNLAAVLRSGGRLVAQCGGIGNVEALRGVARAVGDGFDPPRNYGAPLATAARLEASGFAKVEVWLSDEPTRLEPGDQLETYLETVCLREHVARLPMDERRAFVREVARQMPEPVLDYVRLNIIAVRRA
jgi:trans-aconitate 2-methyltransferase